MSPGDFLCIFFFLNSTIFGSNEVLLQSSDYKQVKAGVLKLKGSRNRTLRPRLPPPLSFPTDLVRCPTLLQQRKLSQLPLSSRSHNQLPKGGLCFLLSSWIAALQHSEHPLSTLPSPSRSLTRASLCPPGLSPCTASIHANPVRSTFYPDFNLQQKCHLLHAASKGIYSRPKCSRPFFPTLAQCRGSPGPCVSPPCTGDYL